MKNTFLNKQMPFVWGLIIGAILMLLFTFAIPGKRTYVGTHKHEELEIDEVKSETEEIIETAKVDIKEGDEDLKKEPYLEDYLQERKITKETIPPVEPDKKITELMDAFKKAKAKTEMEDKPIETTEEEIYGPEIISHEHIPQTYKYEMKE